MAKPILQNQKLSTCSRLCIAATASLVICLATLTFTGPLFNSQSDAVICPPARGQARIATGQESKDPTFYDYQPYFYTIDEPVIEWDRKRSHWFKLHPTFSPSQNRVLVITGSQSWPCANRGGDNFLLRLFKNKVDYCRIHGYEIFYNNAHLHPKMTSYWAKIPVLRAAMVARPEVEWLFWVDSDAIFTDMDFEIPLERYKDYNMIVHGWTDTLYENKSWVSVNAGVFMIRNCQWSMEFLDVWAEMGPKSPNFKKWGPILTSTLTERTFLESDDQSALVYQILKGKRKWRRRIYVQKEYVLHGYWIGIVGRLDEFRERYGEIERGERRHAEAVGEEYAAERGRRAAEEGWRRPFVTHFSGCQPCSGDANPLYEEGSCTEGMERALNFADNQVLRNYGFVRPDIGNSSSLVVPLPFRHPRPRFDLPA